MVTAQNASEELWQKGTLLEKSGGKTEGWIAFRLGTKNHQYIDFKKSEDDKEKVRYTPLDIDGYINEKGERYVKKYAKIDEEKEKLEGHFFFKWIVEGKANLYLFTSPIDKTRYYLEKGEALEELTQPVVSKKIKGKTYKQTHKKYLGILRYLFVDCSKFGGKELSYDFTLTDLTKAVNTYNNCSSETTKNKKIQKEKWKISPGVRITQNISDIKVGGDDPEFDLESAIFEKRQGIGGAFFVEFVPPRFNRQLSIVYELGLSPEGAKSNVFHCIPVNPGLPRINCAFDFDYTYIVHNLLARYRLTRSKLYPILGAGFQSGVIVSDKNRSYVIELENGDIEQIFSPRIVNYSMGGLIGEIGVGYKLGANLNLMAVVRYRQSTIRISVLDAYYRNQVNDFSLLLSF